VILGTDAFLQVREWRFARGGPFLPIRRYHILPAFLHHFARHRHLDAQELVAFTILPWPGLEKTGQAGHLGRVGMTCYMGKEYIHIGMCRQQREDINYLNRLQAFLIMK
jgi:hypothetical protein